MSCGRIAARPQAAVVAPGKKPIACACVSSAGTRVTDVGGEKFDVAPRGLVAEIGDQRRHDIQCVPVRCDLGRRDGRRKLVVRLVQNMSEGSGRWSDWLTPRASRPARKACTANGCRRNESTAKFPL